ncbi:PD-(D/E)XK nuclease superfamily protein [Actinopolymorpha cephalotaxi]|uniref:PD-(D/E)XK nuclease superfamily protein n=1 Tax=Actinopolymorpha cephalotaxi TaxID=504797 RepID=A0A1I2YYM1_9ACTN|nr:PD-(D/E)XK nuclease family protein [Actinopolymorpha cephalotaxi]NYH81773.1 RecB family exonuclease [Actinopolymorpha cephalotaxi]SFH30684.1 PD-(D/E)XK nuclease superfamily protein [Actinopolymorpha cephalotaxi]
MSAMEQLGFEAMPRRLFRATPTRLVNWLDCPRRYRFTYLDRPTPPKGPPWAHNSVGACVHTALAAWWRLPVEERTPVAAARIAWRAWIDEGFRDDAQSQRWRMHACRLVEDYVTDLDPADEPVGVERTVALTTSTLALSGRVDRIDLRPVTADGYRDEDDDEEVVDGDEEVGAPVNADEPDGAAAGHDDNALELVVVDYKSGARVLTTADARSSLALAVYAAATARTLRRPCRKVELHHLASGTVVGWEHTEESLRRHLHRADQMGAEAARAEQSFAQGLSAADLDEVFPPRPGPLCQWCDFSAHCPQGRSAYPAKRPWDGLDSNV